MSSRALNLYVARAAMSPVMRKWGGLVLSEQGRKMKAQVEARYGAAVVAEMDLAIGHSVAEVGMERTSKLLDKAINEAGGNDLKFRQLLPIALNYQQTVTEVQRRLIDPYEL